jgi:sRNA-binding regulator protein Hfq
VKKVNRKLIRPTLAEVKNRDTAPPPHRERLNDERPPRDEGDRDRDRDRPPRPGGGDRPRPGGGYQSRPPSGGGPRGDSASSAAAAGRKRIPPSETNAEIFYYKKQMDAHTPMVIVLIDGEEVEGTIEWYDRNALKVNRRGAPNILLLKHNIKYMYKAEDRDGGDGDDGDE